MSNTASVCLAAPAQAHGRDGPLAAVRRLVTAKPQQPRAAPPSASTHHLHAAPADARHGGQRPLQPRLDAQQQRDQLGGHEAVEAAVGLFYDKLLADPELAPYFEGMDMRQQRRKQGVIAQAATVVESTRDSFGFPPEEAAEQ
ncbi:hypothetical protein ABPG75_004052 [Micractinium tetrahymenae]